MLLDQKTPVLWTRKKKTHKKRINCCLVNLIDDTNSKLLDVVSAADVDAKECVDYTLVDILSLIFCREFESGYLSR